MAENKKKPEEAVKEPLGDIQKKDISSLLAGEDSVPPPTFCTRTVQKAIKAIQNQLVNDNLYTGQVAASLKKTLPALRKIALEGNHDCCEFVAITLSEKTETTKKELIAKEAQTKRYDHFTRFLLNPFEKFITIGGSQDVSPERIPRKIIPVIKQAINFMVPAEYLEKCRILSDEIVDLYPDPEKGDGRDWEGICRDWKIVFEAMPSYTRNGNSVDWEEVCKTWKADFQEEARVERLKKIAELILENNLIIKKLIEALTGPEYEVHLKEKLRECMLDHVFNETGHEPEEDEAEKMADSLIKVLSKDI